MNGEPNLSNGVRISPTAEEVSLITDAMGKLPLWVGLYWLGADDAFKSKCSDVMENALLERRQRLHGSCVGRAGASKVHKIKGRKRKETADAGVSVHAREAMLKELNAMTDKVAKKKLKRKIINKCRAEYPQGYTDAEIMNRVRGSVYALWRRREAKLNEVQIST